MARAIAVGVIGRVVLVLGLHLLIGGLIGVYGTAFGGPFVRCAVARGVPWASTEASTHLSSVSACSSSACFSWQPREPDRRVRPWCRFLRPIGL
jgi:hypothetical protein